MNANANRYRLHIIENVDFVEIGRRQSRWLSNYTDVRPIQLND